MIPQENFVHTGPASFILYEEVNPPDAVVGETKTKNNPPNQPQRPVVTYRGIESDFKVSVEMALCVHGWNTPEKKLPMSLMVFDYRLLYAKRDHHVASIKTQFTFNEAQSPKAVAQVGAARAEPQVVAYAPFERKVTWNETEADVKTQGYGSGKVGWNSGVTAELGGGGQKEVSHIQRCFAQGQASRQYNNKNGKWDRVFWFLQQNDRQGDGVPPTFSVAILLRRASQAKFEGTFSIRLEAGLWEDIKSGLKRFFSKVEDDPVNFDPQREPEGGKWANFIDHIDTENLGQLAADDELIKLVEVWGIDLGAFGPQMKS